MAETLSAAVADAVAARGTVMLRAAGSEWRWCAVCASVQGDIELRLGETRVRGARRWLETNEFVYGTDAWMRPMRSGEDVVQTLAAGLEHAFGMEPGAELERVLVHPGVVGAAPPPGAAYAEHLAAAIRDLVAAGRSHLGVDCGRPARPLAWVNLDAGGIVVEVQKGRGDDDFVLGRYRDPETAGRELAERLQSDFGFAAPDPLFIALMPLEDYS